MENKEKVNFAKRNSVIVSIAVVLVLIAGSFWYYQNYIADSDVVDEKLVSVDNVVDSFLSAVESRDLNYISSQTRVGDEIDFGNWHDVKTMEVKEIRHESESTALVRVDFEFTTLIEEDEVFEYPLTLVFVLEFCEEGWVVDGVEYDLGRYNEVE